jgi:hypothetical protein
MIVFEAQGLRLSCRIERALRFKTSILGKGNSLQQLLAGELALVVKVD